MRYKKNSKYINDSQLSCHGTSTIGDFNSVKDFTIFSSSSFSEYKQRRDEALGQREEEEGFKAKYPDVYDIWLKCFRDKYNIENNLLSITANIRKEDLKTSYYDSNNEELKFVTSFFPEISYIHDERNFSEEESGKANTLTYDLFTNKILNKNRNSMVNCSICEKESCTECFCLLKEKSVEKLTVDDLEKLLNIKLKDISQEVSKTISEYFQENYAKNYSIRIMPQCNINKSVAGISTKIHDPNIHKELSISNVGAGLRNIYNLSLLQAYNKLYGNNPSNNRKTIYLLEEPEIYLHPSLQKEMCAILHELSQNNQIIFTTHSPLMLKNFDSSQIRKVSLNQSFKTEISNTDITEILGEIGYSTTDLLQTEFVIICEGKDDKERISLIIEKFYNLDTKKIFFLNAKGCTNIETYATLEFLDRTELKDNFAIIRDSDTEDIDKIKGSLLNKYKENVEPEIFESMKNRILILKYSSLECYFLNPDILYKMGIILNNNEFDMILSNYIKDKRDVIERYIKERNKKNNAKIIQLIGEIYNITDPKNRVEYIKKNVRGHDLFELFPQLKGKIHDYIEESTNEDFKEIIQFLNKLDYFKQKRKGTRTLITRTLLDYDK